MSQPTDGLDPAESKRKADFIAEHFPPGVIASLKKVGLLKKGRLTNEYIEERICARLGLKSIFDYATMLDGVGYHLSLTSKGIQELRNRKD